MKTFFAKYNRDRLPEFQIVTMIKENEDNCVFVRKESLTSEAIRHIEKTHKNAHRFAETYASIGVQVPDHHLDETGLSIDYVDAVSLEKLLLEALHNNDFEKFRGYINNYLSLLDKMVTTKNAVFEPSAEYIGIFGEMPSDKKYDLIKLANIDLIFGNIFVKENSYIIIDCEWVFDFEIPKEYIIWRALSQFSDSFLDKDIYLKFKNYISTLYDKKDFIPVENSFFCHVFGKDNTYIISNRTLKKVNDLRKDFRTDTVLYYGSDGSFTAGKYVFSPICVRTNQITEVSFDFPQGQKLLRWDLIPSRLFRAKILDIRFYDILNEQIEFTSPQIINNGCLIDDYVIFINADPCFIFSAPENACKLIIRCRLEIIRGSLVHHYTAMALQSKDRIIHQKDNLLQSKDRIIHQKDNLLQNLKRSKSYKIGRWITFPLRFIMKRILK